MGQWRNDDLGESFPFTGHKFKLIFLGDEEATLVIVRKIRRRRRVGVVSGDKLRLLISICIYLLDKTRDHL